MEVRLHAKRVTRSSITCPNRLLAHQPQITAVRPSALKLKSDSELTLFVMRVAAESGSGLMERSEKPGNDPIFGDGISPA